MVDSRQIVYYRLVELRNKLMSRIKKVYDDNILYAFNFKSDMIFKHINLSNHTICSDSIVLCTTASGGAITGFRIGFDVSIAFRADDTILSHNISLRDDCVKSSSFFKRDINEEYSPSNSYKFECSDEVLNGLIDDYYKMEDDIIKAYRDSIEDVRANKSTDRFIV